MSAPPKPKAKRPAAKPAEAPPKPEVETPGAKEAKPASSRPILTESVQLQKPTVPQKVEVIPSARGDISALASANAPFLYFDGAPNFGINNGVVNVTLEAVRFTAINQEIVPDRVIVAHLRMGITAAQALKTALDKVLLLAAPVANDKRN